MDKSLHFKNPSSPQHTLLNNLAEHERLDAVPILWAVDAFPGHDTWIHEQTALMIHSLFPHAPVHAIYVLNEETYSTQPIAPLKNLESILESLPAFENPKPRVLVEASNSKTTGARSLLRYAERARAGLIILGAHQRPWLSRLLMGSFSQSLLDESPLPLLLTGPSLEPFLGRPNVIVFPTDFSDVCTRALDEMLELCLAFDAELHLFHRATQIIDPLLQTGVDMLGGGWIWTDALLPPHDDYASQIAEDWIAHAKDAGVEAKFLSQNFRETNASAIVEYTKSLQSKSPLVALAAGPGSANKLTRDVVLNSPVPVYISSRDV